VCVCDGGDRTGRGDFCGFFRFAFCWFFLLSFWYFFCCYFVLCRWRYGCGFYVLVV